MKKEIEVVIKGILPLLMHSFPLVPIENPPIEKRSMQEQAELALYKDPDGKIHIPGINIQRALIAGATYSKGKGRSSLQKSAAACLLVSPERIILKNQKYEIDARPIVVPATKGRIVRYRPRFDSWELSFTVEYEDSLLTEKQLREIIDNTGSRVGLLDFRPEKKGPFGRFMVTKWS